MTRKGLEPKDLLVYVTLKRYMNKDTNQSFPSVELISKKTSLSRPTIFKSIEKLKEAKYITVNKKGRSNLYEFNPHLTFEPFNYDFLDKEDLTSTEKSYLLVSQQFMFKDDGFGKISFTDLSSKINMPRSTITTCNNSLKDKGYLTTIKINNTDEVGIMINEKLFHLNDLGQTIIFSLQNHENRIDSSEKTIELLVRQMADMQNKLNEYEKQQIQF